jgi:hypothetical protein
MVNNSELLHSCCECREDLSPWKKNWGKCMGEWKGRRAANQCSRSNLASVDFDGNIAKMGLLGDKETWGRPSMLKA